jgi:hypothetical protein
MEKRASAVRYWESRRLGFNLMLLPPGVCGWLGYISTLVGADAIAPMQPIALMLPLLVALIAVNVLYSAVYCLEFLLMSDGEAGYLLSRGRDVAFAAGSVAVIGLAFLGGAGIAAWLVRPVG